MAVPRAQLVELGWVDEECAPTAADVAVDRAAAGLKAPSGTSPSEAEWSTDDSKLLLDKYQEYLSQVGPFKKFRNKKLMWTQICADLEKSMGIVKTPLQCENRYKTILKRKSKVCAENHTSGSTRKAVEFEEEINKIKAIDDSVEPEVLRGVGRVEVAGKRKGGCATSRPPLQKARTSSNESLLGFLKEKESAREKRHQEKMDLLKSIFQGKTPTTDE